MEARRNKLNLDIELIDNHLADVNKEERRQQMSNQAQKSLTLEEKKFRESSIHDEFLKLMCPIVKERSVKRKQLMNLAIVMTTYEEQEGKCCSCSGVLLANQDFVLTDCSKYLLCIFCHQNGRNM